MSLRLKNVPPRRPAFTPEPAHTRRLGGESEVRSPGWAGAGWGEVLLIAVLALAVRLVRLDHTPQTDELNHILAARSLLQNGTLELVAGGYEYTRGWLLTYVVAGLFWLVGESLSVARLPAVAAGAALVVTVFVAVRAVGGRTAGWIAALLVCFSPIVLYQSQQVRFYTLQALFFVVGALAVYLLSVPGWRDRRRAVALALVAAASFAVALHFQIATVVGIGAVLLWLVATTTPRLWGRLRSRRARLVLACAVAVALGGAALLASQQGVVDRMVGRFMYADVWAEHQRENPRYYHWLFLEQYATIWTLFPLLLLVAATRHARPALFCALVFGAVFVAHSLAAWKAERYIMYALPFFFAAVALGAAQMLRWAVTRVRERVESRAMPSPILARAANTIAVVLVAAALLFAIGGNGAASYSMRMMLTPEGEWFLPQPYRGESDWAGAAELLGPELDSYEVIVASSELKSLYFLGRFDYDLVPEPLYGSGPRPDSTSHKSGARWVLDVGALDEVVRCHESGLVLVERGHWLEPIGVHEPMTDYLRRNADAIDVPEAWRLRIFRWRHAGYDRPATCA